jgi:hypothetical protein
MKRIVRPSDTSTAPYRRTENLYFQAERHAGVEPAFPVWRTGTLPLCYAPWFPEDSNLVPAALHAAALPGELENHGRACRI